MKNLHPKTNKQGHILTRYVLEDIRNREWDNFFASSEAYKLVQNLKSAEGKVYGKRIIYRAPLTEEWLKEKEESEEGYKCLPCMDTGIEKEERGFCKCELGNTARKCFSNITNIKA